MSSKPSKNCAPCPVPGEAVKEEVPQTPQQQGFAFLSLPYGVEIMNHTIDTIYSCAFDGKTYFSPDSLNLLLGEEQQRHGKKMGEDPEDILVNAKTKNGLPPEGVCAGRGAWGARCKSWGRLHSTSVALGALLAWSRRGATRGLCSFDASERFQGLLVFR